MLQLQQLRRSPSSRSSCKSQGAGLMSTLIATHMTGNPMPRANARLHSDYMQTLTMTHTVSGDN
jgi:hypothetical protein